MSLNYYEGKNNPPPAGPYHHAVRAGRIVATAGQVGVDPTTGDVAGEDAYSQTVQAIHNLQAALQESGSDLTSTLRIGVFLTSPDDFAAVNKAYREHVPQPFPARTTVYVGLNPGLKVELDAIAITTDSEA